MKTFFGCAPETRFLRKHLLMLVGVVAVGSLAGQSTASAQDTLPISHRKEYLKWYSDGNGGQFALRAADLKGPYSPLNLTNRRERIRSVRTLYIGIGENQNSVHYNGSFASGQWSTHIEKARLAAYRVELDIVLEDRVNGQWKPVRYYTKTTRRFSWGS